MGIQTVVIGGGPAGYTAALRAAQRGAQVTLVEQAKVGGTCLHWGCIPTKVLSTVAGLLEQTRRTQPGIIFPAGTRLDLPALLERQRKVIADQEAGIHKLLRAHKVTLLQGQAFMPGQGGPAVQVPTGENRPLAWQRLILATGSAPLELRGMPFDGRRILSSNEVLTPRQIPDSLLIVGGGVIGCEFASIYSAFGARVRLVEVLPRLLPLPNLDPEISKVLEREMKKRRIQVLTGHRVEHVDEKGDKLSVAVAPAAEESTRIARNVQQIEVAQVLVCIGRRPAADRSQLERLGVKTDSAGWIRVDEHLETALSGVYAIGDALGPEHVMLAHVASAEAQVAAANACGEQQTMDYGAVPGAIFTFPQVAHVGLSEPQARNLGLQVRCDSFLFRRIAKPHVLGEIAGLAKIVSSAQGRRILGVHLIGPHATELIAEAALAVNTGCSVADLAGTIHAHPTLAEVMQEAALEAMDLGL